MASATELLPSTNTVGDFPGFIFTQVHVNSDQTVASVLAPWLNFSAIIRKHDEYLSIVTQFDADEMAAADGLCSSGCLPHSQVNVSDFLQKKCLSDRNYALVACFHPTTGISNHLTNPIYMNLDIAFIEMCRLNILKLSSYDILSFIQAEANDTNALTDVGVFVTPEPDPPPDPPTDRTISPSVTLSPAAVRSTSSHTTTYNAGPTSTSTDDSTNSSASSIHRHFDKIHLWLLLITGYLLIQCTNTFIFF